MIKTLLFMYHGKEPIYSESKAAFFVHGLKIVEPMLDMDDDGIDIRTEPELASNAILTTGGFFFSSEMRIGILPFTSMLVWGISYEIATCILSNPDPGPWMISEIDYVTFQNVLSKVTEKQEERTAALFDSLDHSYVTFFDIDTDDLTPQDRVEFAITIKSKKPEKEGLITYGSFVLTRSGKRLGALLHSLAYFRAIGDLLHLTFEITIELNGKRIV